MTNVGDYEIETPLLGAGGVGSFYFAKNKKNGRKFGAKIITVEKEYYDSAEHEKEAYLLMKVIPEHRNIVKAYDLLRQEHRERGKIRIDLWFITELCPLGSLAKYATAKDLSIDTKIEIMHQLCEVVHFLHNGCPQPICHRNIKPHHTLILESITGPVVKLSGFALAEIVKKAGTREVPMRHFAGTMGYIAPEQLTLKNGEVEYDKNVDKFSLGLTCLALLEAQPGSRMKAPADEHGTPLATLMRENAEYRVSIHKQTDSPVEAKVKRIIEDLILYKASDRIPLEQALHRFADLRIPTGAGH